MKRTTKKAISFIMAVAILLSTVVGVAPVETAKAASNANVKVIAANEYDDAVRFGDGYLLLKNGKLNKVTSSTKYIYVDKNGDYKRIPNKVKFDKVFLSVTGSIYYSDRNLAYANDQGVLVVGKKGKVGIMDMNGVMFGGKTNFYEAVLAAGPNMFFTTNATKNKKNKSNTGVWTLRKKDGTVVKEFKGLDLESTQPLYANGVLHVPYKENKKNKYAMISSDGKILNTLSGFKYGARFQATEGANYSVVKDDNYSYILDHSGKVITKIKGECSVGDVNTLDTYGIVHVFARTSTGATNLIVNKKGEVLLETGKAILDYDSNNVLYGYGFGDEVVFNYNTKKEVMSAKKEYKKNFKSYSYPSLSLYLANGEIIFSPMDNKELNKTTFTTAKVMFYSATGKKLNKSTIKGHYVDGSAKGMAIQTGNSKYVFRSLDGKIKKEVKGVENMYCEWGDYKGSNIVATVYNSQSGYQFVKKDGSLTDSYESYSMLANGNRTVSKYNEKTGEYKYALLTNKGKMATKLGEYDSFREIGETGYTITTKDNKFVIFGEDLKVRKSDSGYKVIGDYVSTFSIFGKNSYGYEISNEYYNVISEDLLAITVKKVNGKDKIGLVRLDGKGKKLPDVFPTSVKLNKKKITLNLSKTKTATLKATVNPKTISASKVSWTSSNTKVAKVSKGKVTAVGAGSATITAKYGDKTATCSVTVKPAKVANVKAKKTSSKKVNVTWKKASAVSGYTVYCYNSSTKKDVEVKTVSAKTSKVTVTKVAGKQLQSGKKYTFKVAAYKTVSGKKVYGDKVTVSVKI